MEFMNVTLGFAFLAGIASFLSPCVFALVPAYIGYLGGKSAGAGRDVSPWISFSHGLAFVLGFSVVFILFGLAASAIGGVLSGVRYDLETWLARIGGVIVIIFGIHMIGIYRIKFLEFDTRRQSVPDRNLGYLASGMMGVFFAAGWSPCIGPILGAILTMLAISGGSTAEGAALLAVYSAGLAIPFLLASIFIGAVTTVIRQYGKLMRYVEIMTGIILVAMGILLVSGRFGQLNAQFSQLGSFVDITNEVAIGWNILIIVLILVVLGLIPAFIARSKGRSFRDWWLFGSGLFPVALPMSIWIKSANPDEDDAVLPDMSFEDTSES